MNIPVPVTVAAVLLCYCPALVCAAPGNVDAAFDPVPNSETDTIAIQPDGKMVVAGNFGRMGGITRHYVARLNPDGSLDPGFNPDSGAFIRCATVQNDGRVLLTGLFTTMGGAARNRVARVLPDGSLDTAFNPDSNNDTYSAAVQPGGGIIFGGLFTGIAGAARNSVARFLPNGALDPAFNPSADANVRTPLPMTDGRTLISGNFTTVSGTPRGRVAILTAAGALDNSFNANVDGAVYCSALQGDGKILIGGLFTSVGGQARNNFARLIPDGSPDNSFIVPVNDMVRSIAVQANGGIIIGGHFSTVGPASRTRLAKLLSDGGIDGGFSSPAASGGPVFAVTLQADGKVVLAGQFTTVAGLARPYLARLENDEATETLSVLSNSLVRWFRSGACPETQHVTFDVSTDGGNVWLPHGSGTRIATGWESNGLSLPSTGKLRARARTAGGYGGASSGIIEKVVDYHVDPLIGWRLTHFGTSAATGPAANDADPDHDGLQNLVEFAFGRDPGLPDAALLPVWERDEDYYVMTFTRPANVSGIVYTPEYSATLAPGSWTPAVTLGSGPSYTFLAEATAGRLFLRLRVALQ